MNEELLLSIQQDQVNKQINNIKWIVRNSDELIHALRVKVTTENADYFEEETADPSTIFRGGEISSFIENYISIKS